MLALTAGGGLKVVLKEGTLVTKQSVCLAFLPSLHKLLPYDDIY